MEKRRLVKERYLREYEEERRKKEELEEKVRSFELKEEKMIDVLKQTNDAQLKVIESLRRMVNGDPPNILEESMDDDWAQSSGFLLCMKSSQREPFKFP